jgi:acylphosphatase
MTAAVETVRLRIAGKVQGVGYRVWMTRAAVSLGLRGWVRNRRDGSVEALATGPPEALAAMLKLAKEGPPGARVADIAATPDRDDGSAGFVARATE